VLWCARLFLPRVTREHVVGRQFHGTASGDLVLSTVGHWFSIDGNGVSFPVMRSIAIA